MNAVPKIYNDPESTRIQRNMTDTQKKNSNNVKEGKIVNAFVKDAQLSLDETFDTLVISHEGVELPNKVYEKEDKKEQLQEIPETIEDSQEEEENDSDL